MCSSLGLRVGTGGGGVEVPHLLSIRALKGLSYFKIPAGYVVHLLVMDEQNNIGQHSHWF